MKLKIRRYEENDAREVIELDVLALNSVDPGLNQFWPDLNSVEETYLLPGGEFLVGTVDGKVVAMVALESVSAKRGELKRMRVHPDFQGRGFGKAMLIAFEKRAVELGLAEITLYTALVQTAACHLYETNGYKEYGRREVKAGYLCISYKKYFAETQFWLNWLLILAAVALTLLALWLMSRNGNPGLGIQP